LTHYFIVQQTLRMMRVTVKDINKIYTQFTTHISGLCAFTLRRDYADLGKRFKKQMDLLQLTAARERDTMSRASRPAGGRIREEEPAPRVTEVKPNKQRTTQIQSLRNTEDSKSATAARAALFFAHFLLARKRKCEFVREISSPPLYAIAS